MTLLIATHEPCQGRGRLEVRFFFRGTPRTRNTSRMPSAAVVYQCRRVHVSVIASEERLSGALPDRDATALRL